MRWAKGRARAKAGEETEFWIAIGVEEMDTPSAYAPAPLTPTQTVHVAVIAKA